MLGSTLTIEQTEAKPKSAPSTKGSTILIAIDKTTQKMSVFIGGTKKYDWRVSTGRPGYTTPSGTYTATSMNEVWYSKEWDNAPMPHAIFFMTDGHAVHGSYEVKSLGKPYRMAVCASPLKMPASFTHWWVRTVSRIHRSC